ncbi:MAG: 2-C-methyl-D-erythritol 4-phosphate cytidylyltransferase [Deltaproteobacteria bacterium]|nr:2-C-methyl-D-erythritol 4-phosphate cytidylyltransferase [Deltaproteobacteria bacterium]
MGADVPKQFLPLAGRSLLDRTLSAAASSARVDGIVLVLPADVPEEARESYKSLPKVIAAVDGGRERQDSVRNALAALPGDVRIVLIHDAVRPFATPALFDRCAEAASSHGAAVPVIPVRDTVKAWDKAAGTLVTMDRSEILRAQTPQGFRAEILREAYARADREGRTGTDDASLVEAAGHRVVAVSGEEGNIKVTLPEDLRMAAGLLSEAPDFRIGLGGDAHRLVDGRELWLGGLKVEHPKGLLGHSDGDVLLHAVADAIYGALGDRDIGFHFPPGREDTRGISSRSILAHARSRMAGAGFGLVGLDAVVICEEPKIAPLADGIRDSIALILSTPKDRVSVKGKTTEGMGFEGRGEGISAWAVALLRGAEIHGEGGGEAG